IARRSYTRIFYNIGQYRPPGSAAAGPRRLLPPAWEMTARPFTNTRMWHWIGGGIKERAMTDRRSGTGTMHDQHGRWPEAATIEDFQRNLAAVEARIAAACARAGRDPAAVRLLPVSKTKTE